MDIENIQLRTSLFQVLATNNIELSTKEIRIKIGKCDNFFASLLIQNEISSNQFMSIVHMNPSLRNDVTFHNLIMLKPQQRKHIFAELENNQIDIITLFMLIEKRKRDRNRNRTRSYLSSMEEVKRNDSDCCKTKCQVCEWRKDMRQITIRNENKSIDIAKHRANEWKASSTLSSSSPPSSSSSSSSSFKAFPDPFIELFALKVDEGEKLAIHFSDAAQAYLFVKDNPPIDIRMLCFKCKKEIQCFVTKSTTKDTTTIADRRRLEIQKAEWFHMVSRQEKYDEFASLIETSIVNNRNTIKGYMDQILSKIKK